MPPGPRTRRFARAMLRLIAVTRQGLLALERYPAMRQELAALRRAGEAATDRAAVLAAIGAMEDIDRQGVGLRQSIEEQLEAAALECEARQRAASLEWETGRERMPRRWILRKVAEVQQLQAKLADIQERIAGDHAAALARPGE